MINQYSGRFAKKNVRTSLTSKTASFRETFLNYCINKWNKLINNLRNKDCILKIKIHQLQLTKVKENSLFFICNPLPLKLLN